LSGLNGNSTVLNQDTEANADDELHEKINELSRQTNELKLEKDNLKANYMQYVENLVDQINKMTDERESSFEKIKNLENKLTGRTRKTLKYLTRI
jgi:hypothetical protein